MSFLQRLVCRVLFYLNSQIICDYLGWAYDLRSVSIDMIQKRARRTGDGSIFETKAQSNNDENNVADDSGMIWGWNDDQMPAEYKTDALHTKST